MIVDTSALLAVILDEPEARHFAGVIEHSFNPRLSAASYLEAALRLEYIDQAARLDDFVGRLGLSVEPVTAEQARIAVMANRRFGKGRHPAALNYGDCFVYALAKVTGEPLLFKGDDFGRTDIRVAVPVS